MMSSVTVILYNKYNNNCLWHINVSVSNECYNRSRSVRESDLRGEGRKKNFWSARQAEII